LAIFTYKCRSLTISGKDVTDKGLMWLCGHGLGEDDLPPFKNSKKDDLPPFKDSEKDDLPPFQDSKKDELPPFRDSKKDELPSFRHRERDDLSPLRYNKKDDIYHRDSEERGGQPTNKTICHPR